VREITLLFYVCPGIYESTYLLSRREVVVYCHGLRVLHVLCRYACDWCGVKRKWMEGSCIC